ncbi:MAG: hypothetical protein MN733_18010 [Nitrososphaera sp.]|nr:hypothetical protein [Nitrososphaera sp.]
MEREPIAIINAVTALIEATILAVVAFGFDLSTEQVAAIMAVVLAGGTVVQTIMGRNRVSPVGGE